MRSSLLAVVVQVFSILAIHQAIGADPGPEKKVTTEPVRGYSSPREAFNAMRVARDRRDWRTVFASLTSTNQDAAVFGLFDDCSFCDERKPKVRAAMKKYGLEIGKVMAEYSKEYQQKHGIDLDKLAAEAQKHNKEHAEKYMKAHPEIARTPGIAIPMPYEPGEKPEPSLPPVDGEILSKVVLRMVTDKIGFYEEACEAIRPKVKDILEPDCGGLEDLKVSGDKANGWVTVTPYHLAGNTKEADAPVRVECCFRKLNGKWYNGELNHQPVEPPTPPSR